MDRDTIDSAILNAFPAPITTRASAKLNLNLHITGKRQDGYHLLQSLMVPIGLHDVLGCEYRPNEAGKTNRLQVTGPFAEGVPLDGSNLAIKAQQALHECMLHLVDDAVARGTMAQEVAAQKKAMLARLLDGASLRITLDKQIPHGAGLGGGSSDAAALLRLLTPVYEALGGVVITPDALAKMALGLGADVPFCVQNTPAWCEGVGEVMTPIATLPECYMVLIFPRKSISTADCFKALKPPYAPVMQAPTGFATYEDLIAWMGRTHNDVSLPAQTLLPTLADRLTCLGTITDHARMTGSGSACFGLCCSQEQAEAAEEAFASAYPGDWVRVTSLK